MSGFEIVGVVLGTLPLAITALEKYRDGLRSIQRWRRYERELQSLIRNLETERAKLQNVCEKLLTGLVPPSCIEEMVADPRGKLWLEEGTQQRVRMRLWRNWEIFDKNLDDMNSAISRLMKTLGDTSEIDSSKSSSLSIVRVLKRATFSLDRSAYVDLLSTIRDGVTNLESLVTSNIELEPGRKVQSRMRLISIIRNTSLSIYRATRLGFSQCLCKHGVGLRLTSHSAPVTPSDHDEDIAQRLQFQAALSHKLRTPSTQVSQSSDDISWDQVSIEVVPIAVPTLAPLNPPPPPPPSAVAIPKLRNKGTKSVRFGSFKTSASLVSTSSSSTLTTTCRTETTIVSNQTANLTFCQPTPDPEEPLDLCKMLESLKNARSADQGRYGRIFDKDCVSSERRCFTVYPCPAASPSGDNCKMVSLREIISQPNAKPPIQPLTYRDRLQLAVFVASSVLQLYNTPWLPELPTNDHVFFLVRKHVSGIFPSSEHAFLIAPSTYQPSSSPPVDHITPPFGPMPSINIRNPTLLALGILLIEIICGQTIDSLRRAEDEHKWFPNPGPPSKDSPTTATSDENLTSHAKLLSNYVVPNGLLSRIYQASSNYGSAVWRCINGDFLSTRKLDLEDEDFRQAFYSGVVNLLEEDLGHT